MKIVAFAYACEPGKGSEPGAGWAWARILARLGDTWVITRENNRENIERDLQTIPERHALHFSYVDLPKWARIWKRGQRGIRTYQLLWQLAAGRRARRLHQEVGFDLAWHLTMANAWLGSGAAVVGLPFVFGPVGGGVRIPWRLVPSLGFKGAVYEALVALTRTTGRYLNPLARMSWRRAKLILTQNPETREWLPRRYRGKVYVIPHTVLDTVPFNPRLEATKDTSTAIFAGRLVPWKGVSLAIRAIGLLPDWRLIVFGAGPDRKRLEQLAARLNLRDRVEFSGHVSREELMNSLTSADLFLFPSLREEAGWVVAEAFNAGLPVICLDRGGPPLLGGTTVAARDQRSTVIALAEAVERSQRDDLRPAPPDVSMDGVHHRVSEALGCLFHWSGRQQDAIAEG